jgi:exopolysaccharide biosynthesis polyprenyl glycosylphosphotransferase
LPIFFNVELNYLRFFTLFICVSLLLNIILRRLMVYAFSLLFLNKRNVRNIVIVGSNQRAVDFMNYINENAFLGVRVVGFIDDCNFSGKDIPILGNLNSIDTVIRNNVIHGIVVNLPIRSFYDTIRSIISIAQEQGISVNYLTNIFEPDSPYMRSYQLGSIPAVVIYNAPLEDWQVSIKRFIDVVIALVVLVLTSPLILMAAIAIKLTDGGPVFFKQERIGYFKNTFKLIKLRTMSIDAAEEHSKLEALNEMDGPVFKIANDPRVLPVGRFLRRYGIDELPQLVNVLKGDMSIVGPRPLAIRDYEGFSEDWLRRRFSVRPGLTCYWQTMKNRNKLGFHEWMNLDMDYIDNWSLWEDFKIMLRTVPAVIRGTGV